MKKVYLICNAHIDPAWQWEWDEGVSAGVATFHSAVRLLEKYDYIFCHNEAILYEWVKLYDSALFEKITEQVNKGNWRIMGGWFLQPDCVMPCGESLVRQIMVGREFFKEHFPSAPIPKTAINFDSFGHCYGLPQILKKCGYDNYLFWRPNREIQPRFPEEYIWRGLDGSEIRCYHSSVCYLSGMGESRNKIEGYVRDHADMDSCIVLWGVGNHGGGPSEKDLNDIAALQGEADYEVIHAYPDMYFAAEPKENLPVITEGLVNFAPGCYTSMTRIKHKMCAMENLLLFTEKLCAEAELHGLIPYNHEKFDQAQKALLFSQFHDILPGSGIRDVEEHGLQLLYTAQNLLTELRTQAIFALCNTQKKAIPGTFPCFVFNPHPYEVQAEVPLEFMLESGRFLGDSFTDFDCYQNGEKLTSQLIKERSTANYDWRKRVLVRMTLKPASMTRVDCVRKPAALPVSPVLTENYRYQGGRVAIEIDCKTGALISYAVDGKELLGEGGISFRMYSDSADSWALSKQQTEKMGDFKAPFRLMTKAESERYCGFADAYPVRVVEDGAITTCIESLLISGSSTVAVRYYVMKEEGAVYIKVRARVDEPVSMLKMRFPCARSGKVVGQTAFSRENLMMDGQDTVSQRWIALDDGESMLAILKNGVYGSSYEKGAIQLSLLRTPVYCCHYVEGYDLTRPIGSYDHMDMNTNYFEFVLTGGESKSLNRSIERLAKVFNERPYAINVFPVHESEQAQFADSVSVTGNVDCSAFKKSKNGGYILRLVNNAPSVEQVNISVMQAKLQAEFTPFEVKTFRYENGALIEIQTMDI